MAVPTDLVRDFIVASPYGRLLGASLEHIEADFVRVRLPFREEIVTVGDMVHGGAISGLVDIAATAAGRSDSRRSTPPRGTTVGFSINFLAAARAPAARPSRVHSSPTSSADPLQSRSSPDTTELSR